MEVREFGGRRGRWWDAKRGEKIGRLGHQAGFSFEGKRQADGGGKTSQLSCADRLRVLKFPVVTFET